MKIKQILLTSVFFSTALIQGCDSAANVASRNLSTAAEQFEINRRIVFFNGITDTYLLSVEGYCSIEVQQSQRQLEVTCKVANGEYKKHFLGLSDNVSYFAEQIESKGVSPDHYKVIFRPSTIVPDVDIK